MNRVYDPLKTEKPTHAENVKPAKTNNQLVQEYGLAPEETQADPQACAPNVEDYKLWRCSDFEKLTKPDDLDLLGEGIIRRGQVTLLMGQGGLGKSTLSFALAVASARSESHFAGIPLQPSLTTLFFNAEASQWRWQADYAAAKAGTPPEHHLALENRICVAPLFDSEWDCSRLENFAVQIKHAVETSEPDLVVFDPWSEFTEDELDTSKVKASLKKLKKAVWDGYPDAAILVVIHAKPGQEAAVAGASNFGGGSNQRGNRATYNNARAVLSIAPHDDDGTDIVLSLSKSNDAPPLAPRRLRLDRNTFTYQVDSFFDANEWREALKKNKTSAGKVATDEIIRAIRGSGPGCATTADVVSELVKLPTRPGRRTIEAALRKAKDEGLVEKLGNQWILKAT